MKILLTGATGFIGSAFIAEASANGHAIRAALRAPVALPEACEGVIVGDLSSATDWRAALKNCDTVVHLAARVHIMKEVVDDPQAEFDRINTAGTLALAEQAAAAGIQRFLFMSTIKVNGEGQEEPYQETDPPTPQDPYAVSKEACETGLRQIAQKSGMAVTILRPSLVYGPNVGANFLRLMQLIDQRVPLPFGRVNNRRSLVYIGNLVSAMLACLSAETTKNKTYLVSDDNDISTPALIKAIAEALNRRPCLLPIPTFILQTAGFMTGKNKSINRLLGSLCADISAIKRDTGWTPPYSMKEGLVKTTAWYRGRNKSSLPRA